MSNLIDNDSNQPDWMKLNPEIGHFDPYVGLLDIDVDESEEERNVQCGFTLCGVNVLMSTETICEIIKNEFVFPLPNTPGWIRGLVNLRGNLVPVFDLTKRFNIVNNDGLEKTLFVCGSDECAVGFYIEGLPSMIEIDTELTQIASAEDPAPELFKNYINGSHMSDGDHWFEIDFDNLFSDLMLDLTGQGSNKSEPTE